MKESWMSAQAEQKQNRSLNDELVGAAQQLIGPDRNQLGCHRELGCYSAMLPGGSIRALGAYLEGS